jgi:hypothetical protein
MHPTEAAMRHQPHANCGFSLRHAVEQNQPSPIIRAPSLWVGSLVRKLGGFVSCRREWDFAL